MRRANSRPRSSRFRHIPALVPTWSPCRAVGLLALHFELSRSSDSILDPFDNGPLQFSRTFFSCSGQIAASYVEIGEHLLRNHLCFPLRGCHVEHSSPYHT
jgi:hypothetical protein